MRAALKRLRALEARLGTGSPKAVRQDSDVHPGMFLRLSRLRGEDARFNRIKSLRAERLASGDASYCTKILERFDRQAEKPRGGLDPLDLLEQMTGRMIRRPVVERLCEIYGVEVNEAEKIIREADESGSEPLAAQILKHFQD